MRSFISLLVGVSFLVGSATAFAEPTAPNNADKAAVKAAKAEAAITTAYRASKPESQLETLTRHQSAQVAKDYVRAAKAAVKAFNAQAPAKREINRIDGNHRIMALYATAASHYRAAAEGVRHGRKLDGNEPVSPKQRSTWEAKANRYDSKANVYNQRGRIRIGTAQ